MLQFFAKRLAKGGSDATRIRTKITDILRGKGGIVAALLRSPLIGAGLNLTRDHELPRDIDL